MLLDASKEVRDKFSEWADTGMAKHYVDSADLFAEDFLNILKNYAFIFTYRDTDEIMYIQQNKAYPAETEIKQLTKVALSAMKMYVGSHFYEEVLKFIQIRTYKSREEIEAWGDIIGFQNNIYLDLNTFYIVKPALSYLERIIKFMGRDYNKYTRAFAEFILRLSKYDKEDPHGLWSYISKIDYDHFAEGEYELEYKATIQRENDYAEIVNLVIKRDFTKLLQMLPLRRLPVEFAPHAQAPTWEEFIMSSVPPQFRTTLQRFAGYCLLPTKKYGRFLALLGNGSNGKSTFLTILMEIFGEYSTSISLQDIVDGRFGLAALEGKLVNIYPDLPKRKIFNTGLFKALITDEGKFTVEKKFKPPYQTKIMTKFIFGANQLPSVNDDSFAFFRRWLIVNFPRIFNKETADLELLDKLRKEKEGILNWVLAGAYNIQHDKDPFQYPYTEDEIAERYYRAESPVAAFVQDCLEDGDAQDPDYRIKKDELYATFIKYCKEQGLPSVSLSKFTKDLKKYVPISIMRVGTEGNRYYVYAGVKYAGACADGEYSGVEHIDEWEDETDFYVPEKLPVEIYRVWPFEPEFYKASDNISVNGFKILAGENVDNMFLHPRDIKPLLEEGKLVKQEVHA